MKKRVAIARAISLNPKYLFCDEPNSGLDPITAILIDELIKELTEEYSMTTIVNTHDMNSVMKIGEKIIFLSDGVKCWEGSNKEILDSDCTTLNDFVFANALAKQLRKSSTKIDSVNLLVINIFSDFLRYSGRFRIVFPVRSLILVRLSQALKKF